MGLSGKVVIVMEPKKINKILDDDESSSIHSQISSINYMVGEIKSQMETELDEYGSNNLYSTLNYIKSNTDDLEYKISNIDNKLDHMN